MYAQSIFESYPVRRSVGAAGACNVTAAVRLSSGAAVAAFLATAAPALLVTAAPALLVTAAPALAQSSDRASNIAPADTHSLIAPRLPLPPPEHSAPWQLMQDARAWLVQGETGAAQEALERAETRLLDLGDPTAAASERHAQLLQAVTEARQALGHHNPGRAEAILTAALGAPVVAGGGAVAAAAPPAPPAPAPELAYPPRAGGWQWNGAQWVLGGGAYAEAPPAAAWVPGHWAWRGGWVWIPGHWRG
jgi:hypothetical protein